MPVVPKFSDGNIRTPVAPYGFAIRDGKLVPSKADLRICRTVVDLIVQKNFSANAVTKELGRLGFKTRSGQAEWHHGTVISILKRWKGKI